MQFQRNKSVGSTAGIKRTGDRVCKHVAGGSVSFIKDKAVMMCMILGEQSLTSSVDPLSRVKVVK